MIETDTLVVGAGPQALTVVAQWLDDRPEAAPSVTIVDPAGSWLHAWHGQFDRQCIDFLRSPGVHHPDPDDMAFLHRYADMDAAPPSMPDSRGPAARARCAGRLRRPATGAFAEFCDELIERSRLADRVIAGTVVGLRSWSGGWVARLDDGAEVRARQVVWAANPRRRVVPSGVRLGGAVVHGVDVDVADAQAGARIAVFGGGQTAGQLALHASGAGARVVLASRAPTRIADLDVDAGWLMDDHLEPFRAIDDPAERRRIVADARRGSMTPDLVDELRRSSVRWCADAGALSAWPVGDVGMVQFAGASCEVDRVWVATGTAPDLRADPALAALAADGAVHVDGWPVLSDGLEWVDGLFVVGALASLTVGPAAGNLGGAREAAELLQAIGP